MVNEYNYMHEISIRLRNHLMPLITESPLTSWPRLFEFYDENNENIITKLQLQKMLEDAGMNYVSDAETGFAFNVIAKFQPYLNRESFTIWGESMHGKIKKKLIYYSQYLDIKNMKMDTQKEWNDKRKQEQKFYHAIQGNTS